MKSYHSIVVPIRLATAINRIARRRSASVRGAVSAIMASLAIVSSLIDARVGRYIVALTRAAPAASARSFPSAARRDNGIIPQSVQANK